MPADNGSGCHLDERFLPSSPALSQYDPEQLVGRSESPARALGVKSQQLLTQSKIFEDDILAGPECTNNPVWSKISNALKRLGFQSHNFLTQLLCAVSRACTIRVRRSTLGRLWNELGSHAGLHHRHRRSRTAGEERISGCGEPYPESPDQGPAAPVGS